MARLGFLFGGLYFIQGIVEPQNGLMFQPILTLLSDTGHSVREHGHFNFWVGLPWALKPLYGVLSDFVPIAGWRRKSWLIITALATALGYGVLALFPAIRESYGSLLGWLIVANVAVAFTDVVVDAAMVETGQPLGITGRLQSIQWGCMYASMAIAGHLAGMISAHKRQDLGFLICAGVALGTVALTAWGVEERRNAVPAQSLGSVLRSFGLAFQSRMILLGGGFLFLWNFNPFSQEVLNEYEKVELQFGEEFRGHLLSISALAQMAASFAYAFYCTRVSFRVLVHASIVLGILNTLGFWWMDGPWSAQVIVVLTGFVYQTATMIQLDLAARVCPPQIAGTMFALLMALSNLGMSASSYVGGQLYEDLKGAYGATTSFQALVGLGAVSTAACWFIVPWLLAGRNDRGERAE